MCSFLQERFISMPPTKCLQARKLKTEEADLRFDANNQCVLCCEGRKTCPHFVPVEDWGPWTEGEGLRDETLERSLGHQHAAWTRGATLSWRQEEGRGEMFTIFRKSHFLIFEFKSWCFSFVSFFFLRCVVNFSLLLDTNGKGDLFCRSCTASRTTRSESCLPPSRTFPTSTQKRASIMEELNVYASSMRSSPTLTVWVCTSCTLWLYWQLHYNTETKKMTTTAEFFELVKTVVIHNEGKKMCKEESVFSLPGMYYKNWQ